MSTMESVGLSRTRHDLPPAVSGRATRGLDWLAESCRRLGRTQPGDSILVMGRDADDFSGRLWNVLRGECEITTLDQGADGDVDQGQLGDACGRHDVAVCLHIGGAHHFAALAEGAFAALKPGGRFLVLSELRGGFPSDKQLYELISEFGFTFITSQRGLRYRRNARRLAAFELVESSPLLRGMADTIAVVAFKPHPPAGQSKLVPIPLPPSIAGKVSIVVPCHNEERNVGSMVRGLVTLYGSAIREIVLVDDNSKDGTAATIADLARKEPRIRPVYRKPPNGVGRAISDGIRATTGEYVLTLDSDFQHILPEIREMFEAVADGYDVAVGSRFSPRSILRSYPYQKLLVNRGFNALAQLLLRGRFRDLTNNCKMMSGDVARSLAMREPGFAINAETGFLPLLLGCRVKEVPVSWLGRSYTMGSSSFRVWKVGMGYIGVLWRVALARYLGRGPYARVASRLRTRSRKASRAFVTSR